MPKSRSFNRLANEPSPYLLQHKDNPVHWWPWGSEALAEAKKQNKPILLSVGYAACHWCHVMAHESFEDEATAAVMNELYINIKVDREERPDIDAIYMSALNTMGEQGGWPLTMFLTPDGQPFWGGTYFPREAKFGKPAFRDVLKELARIFHEEPDKVAHNSQQISQSLTARDLQTESPALSEEIIADLGKRFIQVMDQHHGGIKTAPKFPQTAFLSFLWRSGLRYGLNANLDAVRLTLEKICQGGIYDHLGGGFARYSVDAYWKIPHFEKMLYDNAQLVELLSEVYREQPVALFRQRVIETVNWVLREMRTEGGGFAASFDADSEGEEGKYYVWSRDEIMQVLGPQDGHFFCTVYDITEDGNFEGKNNPNRLKDFLKHTPQDEAQLKELREKLLAVRETRVRPGWDDKVLADWNGLMISALVKAGQVFDHPAWIDAATQAFDFICNTMMPGMPGGRLIHAWRAGEGRAPATASDYANMISAALALYQASFEQRFLDQALSFEQLLAAHYWDREEGGYFFTADDTSDVIVRLKRANDEATPSANAVMASNLMVLYLLTGEPALQTKAEQIVTVFTPDIIENLIQHAGLMSGALDVFVPQHLVLVGRDRAATRELLAAALRVSLPGAVIQRISDDEAATLNGAARGKLTKQNQPTAYICIGPTCSAPVTDPEALIRELQTARTSKRPTPLQE